MIHGYDTITLGQLIDTLAAIPDQDRGVSSGFTYPHSWRGVYAYLAFEPAADVTVASMLADARSAVGKTFQGYKGGDYTMTRDTPVFIAEYGCCGDNNELTEERLQTMLGTTTIAAAKTSALPIRPQIIESHLCINGMWCVTIPAPRWDEFKAYVNRLEEIAAKAVLE